MVRFKDPSVTVYFIKHIPEIFILRENLMKEIYYCFIKTRIRSTVEKVMSVLHLTREINPYSNLMTLDCQVSAIPTTV